MGAAAPAPLVLGAHALQYNCNLYVEVTSIVNSRRLMHSCTHCIYHLRATFEEFKYKLIAVFAAKVSLPL